MKIDNGKGSAFIKMLRFMGMLGSMSTSIIAQGHLVIHNRTEKPVSLKVIADPFKALDIRHELSAQETLSLTVTPQDLKGATRYKLEGTVHIFWGSQCTNLSVDKDYEITFTAGLMGVKCSSEEKNILLP